MNLPPRLRAVSDLHVGHPQNRAFVQDLHPDNAGDWLLVAGDVADRFADIEWALGLLSSRFARVIWAPGNHELWTPPRDPVTVRGAERYRELVRMCRRLGVVTPEDPYPVWDGDGGPATIAPLFVLYDYTFRVPQARTQQESLALAYEAGVVCTDEALLHPDPYPSREAWCAARVTETEGRLAERDPALPTVLVNHYPLVREPTDVLRYPLFAQWCGTVRTSDWHLRFGAATVVYGHLHIPRTTFHDGVRFEEVSLGYPREWQPRAPVPDPVRTINPADDVRRRSSVSG
ncbi:metallophosphoesterase [Micromonospora sp. NPDC053740]|uniref:metallophosphoesterase family protein n=1 Tax=Micromonospora TaxID=1873 RepID=UPI001EE936D1|nr:metallophosphoesterase [Micromonospora alfalfae]MCG5462990.1 metallophosphoesterase [Micromonospora alfalfae]